MSYPETHEQEFPRITPAVQVLIAINVAVMFVAYTIWGDINAMLAFRWSAIDEMRWWTALTYMFAHAGMWHLIVNMYTLFVFGPRLEHMWGTKRFVRFYVLAGLGGLLAHVLFVRSDGMLVGASAAVFGVMGAFAFQWPRQEIHLFGILPMRVWTFVVAMAVFNLAMGVLGAPGVAYFAHLGGFVVAWFYVRTPPGMSIEQLRQRVSPVADSDDSPPRAIPRTLPRQRERLEEVDEIVAKSKAVAAKRPAAATPGRKRDSGAERQEAIDRVLDKISAHGIESLTPAERDLLEEASRRLRDT